MNPEIENIPNIGLVKRSIEYQNYLYNQEQLQRKRQFLKRQKQQQIKQSALQNHQALIELENQKIRSLRRKFQVQDTLQKQYDKQINIHKRVKTQQKSKEKIYSQLQKELLQNQQKNRIFEISKLYQIGSNKNKQTHNNFRQKRMLTQGCQDSLDYLRNQSINDFKSSQQKNPSVRNDPQYNPPTLTQQKEQEIIKLDTQRHYRNSLPYIQQSTTPLKNPNQKKNSMLNLDYADYLKKEIDRRQKQKQIQKRKQLEKDKSWIEDQNYSYYQNVEQMKFFNQKKKQDLASGLEKQLYWKRQYKGL